MRWVVELPAPSGGTAATVTVESDSWAGALSSARGGVSIRKFRCEFESEGVVRVHDLEASERYTVRPYRASMVPAAPEPAQPTEVPATALRSPTVPPASGRPSRAPQPTVGGTFSVAPPPGTSVAIPLRSSTPPESSVAADPTGDIDVPSGLSGTMVGMFLSPAATAMLAATAPAPERVERSPEPEVVVVESPAEPIAPVVFEAPAAVVVEAVAIAETPAVDESVKAAVVDAPTTNRPPEDPASPSLAPNGSASEAPAVPTTLLFERDQDPGPTNPLTYRERVLYVAEGTSVIEAEAVARQTLTTLKRSLATRPRGRYVNVAVFDHRFSQRPSHPPLVVLRWRDWRGDVPEMQIKPALTAVPIPTPAPVTEPVEAPVVNATVAADVEAAAAPEPSTEPSKPAEAPVLVAEASPVVAAETPPAALAAVVTDGAAPTVAPETAVAVISPVETAPVAEIAPTETTAVAVAEIAPPAAPTDPEQPAALDLAPSEAPAAAETATADALATPAVDAPPAVVAAPEAVVVVPDALVAEPTMSLAPEALAEPGPVEAKPATDAVSSVPASAEAPAVEVETTPDRKRFTGGRRGPDLLSDLFDGLMELSFLKDPTEICAFVSGVLTQHLRCDAALVFSYDINRDEFVVHGEANTGRLDQRVRATVGSYGVAARSKRALAIAEARGTDLSDPACDGGAAVFAPGLVRDRLFALVHLARLPGSPAFDADEVDATSYIAGQLAEALASHSHRQSVSDLAEKRDSRR